MAGQICPQTSPAFFGELLCAWTGARPLLKVPRRRLWQQPLPSAGSARMASNSSNKGLAAVRQICLVRQVMEKINNMLQAYSRRVHVPPLTKLFRATGAIGNRLKFGTGCTTPETIWDKYQASSSLPLEICSRVFPPVGRRWGSRKRMPHTSWSSLGLGCL